MPREFSEDVELPEAMTPNGLRALWLLLHERVSPSYSTAVFQAARWKIEEDELEVALSQIDDFSEVTDIRLHVRRSKPRELMASVRAADFLGSHVTINGADEQEVVGLAELLRRRIAAGLEEVTGTGGPSLPQDSAAVPASSGWRQWAASLSVEVIGGLLVLMLAAAVAVVWTAMR